MRWRRRIWILLIIGVIVLASYLLTGELTPKERGGLVILLLTASLWISEAIPLPATSLLVPFLQPLFGLQSFSSALEPFFAPVVALLLGGFLLAKAVEKHDLDEYLANLILSKVRAKPRIVVLALMSATAFLSMWMSNTASAALMLTIALRLVAAIGERDPNLSKVIVLGVAYSSTVGGIATLVGTPTCALAAGALRDLLGYELTFLGWSLYGLPITVAMILIIWLLLFALFRPRIGEIPRAVKRVGPLKRRQKLTLVIFLAAVLLWSSERLPEPLAELVGWRGHGLSSGMVSLLVAVVLFSTELLEGPDLSGVNWGALLLIGGGLSLGSALEVSGLTRLISGGLVHLTKEAFVGAIIPLTAFSAITLSIVASNTASASIFLPIAIDLGTITGTNPVILAVVVGICSSLDFMLPVGTPPNAIAYSTGKVTMGEMIRAGVLLDIIGCVLTVILALSLWPLIA